MDSRGKFARCAGNRARAAACVLVLLATSACSTVAPKPWERGRLARPEMAWDADPLLATYRDHAYVSKEAASGRAGTGGGGCGCN